MDYIRDAKTGPGEKTTKSNKRKVGGSGRTIQEKMQRGAESGQSGQREVVRQAMQGDRKIPSGFKTREVYKTIRNVNRKWQPKAAMVKDSLARVLMNTDEIVQRWTEYCSELYQVQLNKDVREQVIKELGTITPPREDEDMDILEEEVRKAVQRLKNNKSPGNDGVVGEMIKYGGEPVVREMHQICRAAFKEGRTPEEWKKSIITVLHKKGSTLECSNYRTIALMSHLVKVLMSVLTERLRAQTEEHLADEQAGFRKHRSTVQQILTLRLIEEKARRKGKKIQLLCRLSKSIRQH